MQSPMIQPGRDISEDLLFLAILFWFVSVIAGGFAFHAWHVWQKRARALQALVDELVDLVPMDIPKSAALRLQGLVESAYRSGVWDEQYLEPGRKEMWERADKRVPSQRTM